MSGSDGGPISRSKGAFGAFSSGDGGLQESISYLVVEKMALKRSSVRTRISVSLRIQAMRR